MRKHLSPSPAFHSWGRWSRLASQGVLAGLLAAGSVAVGAETPDKKEPAGPAPAPITANGGKGSPVVLRYNYSPGETVYFEVEQKVDFDTTVNGHNQKASTYSKSVKAWKVLSVDSAGCATIENSVLQVDMWQDLTGRARLRYNSVEDAVPPAGFEPIAASLNIPLSEVKFDPMGRVLAREVKFRSPGNVDAEQEINLPMPQGGVAVGGVWELPFPLKVDQGAAAGRVLQARNRFALSRVDDGVAFVDFETQILTPINDPSVQASLIQRGGRGQLRFDVLKGRPIEILREADETVVGFRGAASSMHFVSKFTEKIIPAPPKAASKPAKTETSSK